jgi:membrane protein implicated in regulation of membrane protease activity
VKLEVPWLLRLMVALVGAAAWILSYLLATVGLGRSAPAALVPAIVVFGLVYVIVSVTSLFYDYRSARRDRQRQLQRDAYELANRIRRLIEETHLVVETTTGPHGGATWDGQAITRARVRRSELVVANYEYRFATEARHLARELLQCRVIQTDSFFRAVSDGPTDDHGVLQVAAGLERLAHQLAGA